MLRCSSFKQIKCNWCPMESIVLTAKMNNDKVNCQKQAQVLFFEKTIYQIEL